MFQLPPLLLSRLHLACWVLDYVLLLCRCTAFPTLCALDAVMEAAPFHDAEVFTRDAYSNQALMARDCKDEAWAGYEDQALIEWSPQVCIAIWLLLVPV